MGPDQAAAMEDMDRELRELTERIDFNTQRHPGPPGGRDMTFEEKRRLSIGWAIFQETRWSGCWKSLR